MKLSLTRSWPFSDRRFPLLCAALLLGCSDGAATASQREADVETGGTGASGSGGATSLEGSGGAFMSSSGGATAAGGASGGAPSAAGSGGMMDPTLGSGGGVAGGGGTGGAAAGGGTGGETSGAGGVSVGTGGADDECPSELVGYATVNAEGVNGTSGGGDAAPTIVTTLSELRAAAQDSAPRVVVISGTINTTSDGDGYPMEIKSNKTIVGEDEQATIVGGLTVKNVSNVIITNLNIQGVWPNPGPGDTLSSSGSHHIWFDHLNVWDAEDGLLDVTNESDYQTVSWSKFWYTDASHGHRLASLNGSGAGDHPEDWGRLRVTYHHNWFAQLVDQRMPRVVYGQGHQFNNYYNSPGNGYCIGVGSYGSILVENNYFKDVNNPIHHMYDVFMHSSASGNIFDNTTGTQDVGFGGTRDACPGGDCTIQAGFEPGPFTPPYEYALRPAEDVPAIVQRCAGPQ